MNPNTAGLQQKKFPKTQLFLVTPVSLRQLVHTDLVFIQLNQGCWLDLAAFPLILIFTFIKSEEILYKNW